MCFQLSGCQIGLAAALECRQGRPYQNSARKQPRRSMLYPHRHLPFETQGRHVGIDHRSSTSENPEFRNILQHFVADLWIFACGAPVVGQNPLLDRLLRLLLLEGVKYWQAQVIKEHSDWMELHRSRPNWVMLTHAFIRRPTRTGVVGVKVLNRTGLLSSKNVPHFAELG